MEAARTKAEEAQAAHRRNVNLFTSIIFGSSAVQLLPIPVANRRRSGTLPPIGLTSSGNSPYTGERPTLTPHRQDAENARRMTITGLAACCDERLFVPELRAQDKDAALVELVEHLGASGKVRAPGVILNALRERERMWPTALGRGVALPHARSVVVPEMTLLFARSTTGIDFGAEDSMPVRLIFLIVAPYHDRENRYLPTLGKIVELVSQQEDRKRLLEITQFTEFVALLEKRG